MLSTGLRNIARDGQSGRADHVRPVVINDALRSPRSLDDEHDRVSMAAYGVQTNGTIQDEEMLT
jgi:hypothetical protein